MQEAPRLLSRGWSGRARGGWPKGFLWASVAVALGFGALPSIAQEITGAHYAVPTMAYPHGVLGDAEEWQVLTIDVGRSTGSEGSLFSGSSTLTYEIRLDDTLVFEDTEPRLWDVTGDGKPEVVVVQSHQNFGARLLILGLEDGKPVALHATPHIGTRFRWLAPVGAADFDGDGHIEIAFVDRPHLAKTLRVWRLESDNFYEVATLRGVSNHRIGEDYITGGLRDCGAGPEMILADANWQWVMAARFTQEDFSAERLRPFEGLASVEAALACN